jgi:hypothetical protein
VQEDDRANPDAAGADGRRPGIVPKVLVVLGLMGVGFFALAVTTDIDPDLFHEMAMARAALQAGRLPRADLFAYTPTLNPVIHHEWGAGVLFYGLVAWAGAAGLLALHYVLAAAVIAGAIAVACRRGATWQVLAAVLVPVAPLLALGFTTVRAQCLSLLFTAVLLWFLELDRAGRRWWLGVWPVLHLVWLNCHAGFVVGLGVLVCHIIEELLRTRRVAWRLAALLAVLAALIPLNPYGPAYIPYLWRAVTMPRPLITEWRPLWCYPLLLPSYVLTLALTGYAWRRLGWRGLPGILIVTVAAGLTLPHVRHGSLYALIWLAYAAPWLARTPLAELLDRLWGRRTALATAAVLALGVTHGIRAWHYRPWQVKVPTSAEDERTYIVYPVGPAQYLRAQNFRGNVLAPFEVSAYLSWTLEGRVKVAVDGRYEVAYPLATADQAIGFFDAKPGWQAMLTAYPTDLVLVKRRKAAAKAVAQLGTWRLAYQDDVWVMYARPGLELPGQDRRGQTIAGSFP